MADDLEVLAEWAIQRHSLGPQAAALVRETLAAERTTRNATTRQVERGRAILAAGGIDLGEMVAEQRAATGTAGPYWRDEFDRMGLDEVAEGMVGR